MVLAACSPLLHRILRDNPCRHPVLILGDVPAGDMRAMLKFIYQGEVSVSQSELASFLKTADNLQIKGLAEDKEKEKDREHKSKEDRKRKDKDSSDRSEGRSSHKRQRLSDSRVADSCLTLPHARSHKYGDSLSSHKRNTNKPSTDPPPKNGNNFNKASFQKHTSRTPSSTKVDHRDIPTKVLKASKENAIVHVTTTKNVTDNLLQKTAKSEELTIKMEPLDYPGEVVWTEGHGTVNTNVIDDPQPHTLPLLPSVLDGVKVHFGASSNLPKLDNNDDSRCDDDSRVDASTASDDINANSTVGTWGLDTIPQGCTRDFGTLPPAYPGILPPPSSVLHPRQAHPPLSSSLLQLPPLPPLPPSVSQLGDCSEALVHGFDYTGPLSQVPTMPSIPLPASLSATTNLYSGVVNTSPVSLTASSSCHEPKFTTTVTSSNNNSIHKCQQCSFVSSNPYTFTRHLRIHFGTKEFQCKVCSFASTRKDSLIRHFRMKHLTGEMLLYQDLNSRDIEELALLRSVPEEERKFT
ncbi:hypothetical protein SK128_025553 [Halocaridina rubra]|uniref:Uncharacterized protein n=1 Tax=Halocaridina rubra TaxID=373956 RepID=A0AAN9A6T5_HALRR